MKKLFQIMFICGGLAVMNSCNQQEACTDVQCLYGGACVEGDCECPDGLTGANCQIESFANGVIVLHEGNFQAGNAGVSFLLKDFGTMANGVFSTVNGIPLGDLAQSMTVIGERGFIAVNNSGKIEVVSTADFSSIGTITGLSSPRYVVGVTASKAYVSDLFSGAISIFNPMDLSIIGSIPVSGQVEEMAVAGNDVIAAGTGANKVYKIDVGSDAFSDSVDVGIGPSNVVVDANGKVWAMTNGGWGTEEPKLVRIDPATMSVELSLDFALTDFPSSLKTNADGTALYWVNGGVFKMNITETALPTTAFLSTAVYKVNADPETDMIYVSDAGDFNSDGHVYSYLANGTPVDTFDVGVIPAEFVFTD